MATPPLLRRLALSACLAATLTVAPTSRADDGRAALALAPKEAMLVVSVDLERLRKHPIYQAFFERFARDPGTQEQLAALKTEGGFDVHALESVTVVLPPSPQGSGDALIVLRGPTEPGRFLAFAEKRGSPSTPHPLHGETWYAIDGGGLAFLGDHALAGATETITAAVAVKRKKAPSLVKNAPLMKLVKGVSQGSDLWFAMLVPAAQRAALSLDNPLFGQFLAASGAVTLGEGLKARLTLSGVDAKSATEMAALTREGLAAAGADPKLRLAGLGGVVSRATVEARGKDVHVALDLTPGELDHVVKLLVALAGK